MMCVAGERREHFQPVTSPSSPSDPADGGLTLRRRLLPLCLVGSDLVA